MKFKEILDTVCLECSYIKDSAETLNSLSLVETLSQLKTVIECMIIVIKTLKEPDQKYKAYIIVEFIETFNENVENKFYKLNVENEYLESIYNICNS